MYNVIVKVVVFSSYLSCFYTFFRLAQNTNTLYVHFFSNFRVFLQFSHFL